MNLMAILAAMRLGVYAPGPADPFRVAWLYASAQVYEQRCEDPWGLEIGATGEFVRTVTTTPAYDYTKHREVGAAQTTNYLLRPAFFLGATKAISRDLNVSAGLKYRALWNADPVKATTPYIAVSLRIGAVQWGKPQPMKYY